MPVRTTAPPYRQDGGSKYPFGDEATLTARNGSRILPRTFIDAVLYPPEGAALALTSATKDLDTVTLNFGTAARPDMVRMGPLSLSSAPARASFWWLRNGAKAVPCGIAILDPSKVLAMSGWPDGDIPFPPEAAPLAASCYRPDPGDRLVALTVGNEWMSGFIDMVFQEGVQSDIDDEVLRLHAAGEPHPDILLDGPAPRRRFLKTISGIRPDESGEFSMWSAAFAAADSALRIYAVAPNTIQVEVIGGAP